MTKFVIMNTRRKNDDIKISIDLKDSQGVVITPDTFTDFFVDVYNNEQKVSLGKFSLKIVGE